VYVARDGRRSLELGNYAGFLLLRLPLSKVDEMNDKVMVSITRDARCEVRAVRNSSISYMPGLTLKFAFELCEAESNRAKVP
jgi:hypothetical protein